MSGNSNKEIITVERLLQLKRNERPHPEFWDSFEKDFDRRRLHALVERPSWRDLLLSPAFRVLLLGMPALALVAMAFVWNPSREDGPGPLVQSEPLTRGVEPVILQDMVVQAALPEPMDLQMDMSGASSQFVMDAIHDSSGSAMHFSKVLYTPAIRLSVPAGAFYVRDNLSASHYKVTTTDVKMGSNF